ncbi:beta-N-acetylhexosaminidase [Glaciecola sp. 1036]|uniref:beta-N-acetylhexosaminidase n=1 Tax=Alteromonadaceae TaxID=72275 RepID=UPI003D0468D0
MTVPSNLILGIASTQLSNEEIALFSELKPLGLILFARNLENPTQVTALTEKFRQVTQNERALVLIDQEGGRVSRLPEKYWRIPPSPTVFAKLYAKDPEKALRACLLNHILIGHELKTLGINVNCAPMIDIPQQNASTIVTERAFGATPEQVITLAKTVIEGLQTCGVEPVIKHAPGHGRATADSHLELPYVDASLTELTDWDFIPFKALNDQSMLMTAHINFSQIDPEFPGTLSQKVIQGIIRENLGFEGLIMTDDIDMHALSGTVESKAQQAIAAGCDVVLQCSGEIEKMQALSKVAQKLSGASLARAEKAQALAHKQGDSIDCQAILSELNQLLSK